AGRAARGGERLHRALEGLLARPRDPGRRADQADDDHAGRRAGLARPRPPLSRALPRPQLSAVAARAAARAAPRAGARMTVVAARQVSTRRGGKDVLHAVDLEVARGEVVAIVGPSGSGKTTLLRAFNYLTPFASGVVEIAGPTLRPGMSERA